jgi:FtsP/CotA-like multicopper oxidase with cupredoxin domain
VTGDGAPNCFHGSSTTNIHFHGTHVTPDGLGDNVLLQLRPDLTVMEATVKDDFQKIFNNGPPVNYLALPESWRDAQRALLIKYDQDNGLSPENQLWPPTKKRIDEGLWPQYQIGAYPYCYDLTKFTTDAQGKPDRFQMGQCPGTHWYHAHKHGSTAINVMNGMVGAFIIDGDYDNALEKIYPNLRQTEKVLVVHNVSDRPNMARGNIRLNNAFSSPSLYVNGQLNPTITMQPGEIQLWRLVNATIKSVATMDGFSPTSSATLPEYRQTAQDGVQFSPENFVEQPILNFQGTGKARPNSFAPGNRIDFLVKAPATPGTYPFKVGDSTDIIITGGVPFDIITLVVAGAAVQSAFPTKDNFPAFPSFLKDIQAGEIVPSPINPAKRRTLDFGWEPGRDIPAANATGGAPQFMIDGKKFSGEAYDQEMVLGAVEEWTLENSTAAIAHPFHIHVNPFQVVEIFDPTTGTTYKPSANYVWQDVIAIPPATFNSDKTVKEKGRVTIRHRFVDFVGSYVLHCHMLAHEDRGMMQLIQVVPTKDDLGKKQKPVPHH